MRLGGCRELIGVIGSKFTIYVDIFCATKFEDSNCEFHRMFVYNLQTCSCAFGLGSLTSWTSSAEQSRTKMRLVYNCSMNFTRQVHNSKVAPKSTQFEQQKCAKLALPKFADKTAIVGHMYPLLPPAPVLISDSLKFRFWTLLIKWVPLFAEYLCKYLLWPHSGQDCKELTLCGCLRGSCGLKRFAPSFWRIH